MPSACLYIRVSTDEQAIRGYSQRTQQDRLTKFCLVHNIDILNTIFEDHSAKTFDRPAWSAMITTFRRNKLLRPDLLLFTKWDRFSRNTGDAYYMISQLHNLGITPQATDQKLDLSIPENKIILGVYLATSEAENDRRSINVKQGIRKANQEGRWTAHVPIGYKAHITPAQKREIRPVEPQASLIRKTFELVAENKWTVQAIYNQMYQNGLRCSNSNFRRLLRNPVYCGKIALPTYESESEHLVNGLHQAVIKEALFSEVQKILNQRPTHVSYPDRQQLLLRGFLICPNCNRQLTGSASKGKCGRYYHYYHCRSSCGYRIRADKVNEQFLKQLDELYADQAYLTLYKDLVRYIRRDFSENRNISMKTIHAAIDRQIERVVRAKELLLHGDIDEDDYQIIKTDCEHRIHDLGIALQHSNLTEQKRETSLTKLAEKLFHPGVIFRVLNVPEQREIMEAILYPFPIISDTLSLSSMLKPGLHFLFGISSTNTITVRKHIFHQQWEEEYAQRIMEIEQKRNQKIGSLQAFEIIHFLSIFVKITDRDAKGK
jgi:DNA invertase Pin-like site-specific DNA recombinase